MPDMLMATWKDSARYPSPPEACLINFYSSTAKMGLHQDRDEEDFDAPVVSLSLGDSCLFRVGGLKRSDPTRSVRLSSGDAVVLGGNTRLAFHGVDRIEPGTSTLLPEGGRINLTMRRVNSFRCRYRGPGRLRHRHIMMSGNKLNSVQTAAVLAATLACLVLCLVLAPAAHAADPIFPIGSRVGLVPPAGMVLSKGFVGFEDVAKDVPHAASRRNRRRLFLKSKRVWRPTR